MNTKDAQAAIRSSEEAINIAIQKLREYLGPEYSLRLDQAFLMETLSSPPSPTYRLTATLESGA
jgi:hypothetical protein